MEAKYTPEPWVFDPAYSRDIDSCYGIVATVRKGNTRSTWVDNGRRLVACVNACAGLNPEAMPELVEACKIGSEMCQAQLDPEHIAHNHINWESLRDNFKAALSKAGVV